jgi:acetylornithine deacetylase/succinyl-diaminopimelate desuccinylase-like protein
LRHEVIADSSPTFLPGWLRRVLHQSCEAVGATRLCMTSGASHDAQVVNRIVPSALLFVPSRGGVSHSPDEWTAPEALARGVEVLHDCMRRLDGLLPTRAGEDAA